MNKSDLIKILTTTECTALEEIRRLAEQTLLNLCGKKVYYRGLIEFSNICDNDCFYCGIRRSNANVKRYMLSKEKIVEAALWCAGQGYGSVVLQSGERKDGQFVAFVEDVVRTIKEKSKSERMPRGLGITLSVGEQSVETYKRFYAAGAHRYLLRIETSNPKLYAAIHPANQDFHTRVKALSDLKKAGFQVGTGVMIGLPGQTEEDLADDLLFFQEMDVDMIGMGPYIVHGDTPMAAWSNASDRTPKERFDLALRMIAATRLLRWGANIIMPQVTPLEVRRTICFTITNPALMNRLNIADHASRQE